MKAQRPSDRRYGFMIPLHEYNRIHLVSWTAQSKLLCCLQCTHCDREAKCTTCIMSKRNGELECASKPNKRSLTTAQDRCVVFEIQQLFSDIKYQETMYIDTMSMKHAAKALARNNFGNAELGLARRFNDTQAPGPPAIASSPPLHPS